MRQVILIPDRESTGYTVLVPSLLGCVSEGDTRAEALENVKDAIAAWVETAETCGDEIPEDRANVELALVG